VETGKELLSVQGLKKYFKTDEGTVRAVDGIGFTVNEGETFGLVGESGSGKSTTAYTIMGLYIPTEGTISYKGTDISVGIKKRPLSLKKDMQMVFQDPGTSLNPKRSIRQILELPLNVHGLSPGDHQKRVVELLEMVELPEAYRERSRWWRSPGPWLRIPHSSPLTSPPRRWTSRCRRRS
jgi:ABC-type oligopeptide transport system ATPase subunit